MTRHAALPAAVMGKTGPFAQRRFILLIAGIAERTAP